MDQRPDPDRLPTLAAERSRPEVDLARLRITGGQQLLRVFNPHASLPADRIATASALVSRPAGSADDNP